MYDLILKQLEQRKDPIDIIVIGVGFMGFGFVSSIQKMTGVRIPLIISRRPHETRALLKKHSINVVDEEIRSVDGIKKYADNGYICVSDDVHLIEKYEQALVLEVTGTVDYGAEVALLALKSKKHVITMNPELQVTVGSELKVIADENNVTFTDVIGDQPGSLSRLISHAKLMGFNVRMAGNMKRYLDVHATQEKMAPWAKDKGLAVRQTTSFTDGTKQSIEMDLVGNYFGMKVLKRGMVGPEVKDVKEVLTKFDWNHIPPEGVVDYVIGKDMFPGVFIVAEHRDPNQQKYLRYLGLGDGPLYVLFEPYHLCHLEVLYTIAKVALFNQETINNSTHPINRTIAITKQDLHEGDHLDGIGGDTIYGLIDSIENTEGLLPIGLAHHAILKHDIAADTPLKVSDVILPITVATKLTGYVTPQKKPSVGSFFQRILHLL